MERGHGTLRKLLGTRTASTTDVCIRLSAAIVLVPVQRHVVMKF
jgi:hypothetical protein